MANAVKLKSHEEIMNWVEQRQGKPCIVKGTKTLLRINFPGGAEASLQDISWDEWFEVFDSRNLKFLAADKTEAGKLSRFFKLVEG